jgi:hypothetical protein
MGDAQEQLADTLRRLAEVMAARAIIEYHENPEEAVRAAREKVERWQASATRD